MNSFEAQGKQNDSENIRGFRLRPTHQGHAFRLRLGNDGPFLAKDIMHCNKNSVCLLAAKEVLQSHQNMSSLLGVLNKQTQNQYRSLKKDSNTENWFSRCEFLDIEVKTFKYSLQKVKSDQDRLKRELSSSIKRLNMQNQQLVDDFIPLFRNLLKTIREQDQNEKNMIEERKRDINDLTTFKNVYLDQLVGCQNNIMKIEKILGVTEKDN